MCVSFRITGKGVKLACAELEKAGDSACQILVD